MARRAIGPLSSAIITKSTQTRYEFAVRWFFAWLRALQQPVPCTLLDFDDQVAQCVEAAWQEGESRSLVGDLLSGLSHFFNPLRSRLPSGWRLWSAWGRLELPARAWPLLPDQLDAICWVAAQWDLIDVAIALWVGFDALLRTAEFVGLRVGQLHFKADLTACFVSLPETKGSARKGAPEGVAVKAPALVRLLAKHCNRLQAGDLVLRRSPTQFRAAFKALVAAVNLHGEYKPYSIRRGGATAWFRRSGSIDDTTDRGRWANARTCRIYVNTALADLINQAQPKHVSEGIQTLGSAWRAAMLQF